MDVSVEIHCEICGSANFSLGGGPSDSAALSCNDCGAGLGTVADLKEALLAQAIARSSEALRKDLDLPPPDRLA